MEDIEVTDRHPNVLFLYDSPHLRVLGHGLYQPFANEAQAQRKLSTIMRSIRHSGLRPAFQVKTVMSRKDVMRWVAKLKRTTKKEQFAKDLDEAIDINMEQYGGSMVSGGFLQQVVADHKKWKEDKTRN